MMSYMCFFLCPSIQSNFQPNLRPTRKKKSGIREVGTGNAQTLYGHMGSALKEGTHPKREQLVIIDPIWALQAYLSLF